MFKNKFAPFKKDGLYQQLKYVFPFAKPYLYGFIAGLLSLIATDLGNLLVPDIVGNAIDAVQTGTITPKQLILTGGIIIFVAAVRSIMRFGWRYYLIGATQRIERDMRINFFNHVLRMPIPFFNQNRTGELLALSSNDLLAVKRAFGEGVLTFADFFFATIGTLFFMIMISPELTCYALIPMPLITALFIIFGPKIHHRFKRVQDSFGRMTTIAEESVSGIRIVRAYAQEEGETKHFAKANQDYLDKNLQLVNIDALFHAFMLLLPSLIFPIILVIGGIRMVDGSLSIGQFIAFNMFVGQLVWPMMAIGWTFNIFQRAGASIQRLRNVWEQNNEFLDKTEFQLFPQKNQPLLIEIKNLTFTYPKSKTPIFQNLTLSIPAGKTVAIMGRTGVGKTTLINLLLRLYDPPPGTIFLGGHDILTIPKDILRSQFGVAPQDPFLFTDTLRNNIEFAHFIENQSNQTDSQNIVESPLQEPELIRISKGAFIYEDIRKMPDQFNTIVGERGMTLSGGQRQRTAIARAFMAKRPILILDDPLSAVDTVTESKILDAIKYAQTAHSLILVTHRINAAQLADFIAVIEEGRIQHIGKEKDLLRNCTFYQEIHQHQSIN